MVVSSKNREESVYIVAAPCTRLLRTALISPDVVSKVPRISKIQNKHIVVGFIEVI